MIAAISFWVTPCAFAFFKWNTREESVIPEDMSATTVMILLVFTSMSWLFQFSPKRTSSLKCANWGANSPSALLPAVCTIFAMFFLHFQIGCKLHDPGSCQSAAGFYFNYKDFTQSAISCLEALFKSFPSTISAPGADGFNSFTVLPNPLPPDVAKRTIFLPVKS